MTKINIKNDIDEWIIELRGHAGYGPKGSDIVCAAVSTVTTMIAQMLVYEAEDVRVHRYVVDEENADISFEFKAMTDCVNNKIAMAIIGYELIANTYPDYVRLNVKSV